MRNFATSVCLFTTSLIVVMMICVLSCSAKMTAYLNEKRDTKILTRGVNGLDTAKQNINNELLERVEDVTDEAFVNLSNNIYDNGINITEEEANNLYKGEVLDLLNRQYGAQADGGIAPRLSENLPELKSGELGISENCDPKLKIDGNNIILENVTVEFSYNAACLKDNSFEVVAPVRKVILYDENPELFTYSMVASKGIYITGNTSTVFGNVYAGTHSPSELRKAEALYGEIGSYGGLNIMSTQVAFYSDKIATDGNINMKGAFVVFGGEDQDVTLLSKEIVQTDNVASKTVYALFGKHTPVENHISERAMCDEAISLLGNIDRYYDSDNDRSYTGTYRKIISNTDITVKSDVNGIIMTPGSVIIEEGVNVEGLILSGDRIYTQGNNNIVASTEGLREMVRQELYDEIFLEDDSETLEEKALNSIHLKASDYIGGMQSRGVK